MSRFAKPHAALGLLAVMLAGGLYWLAPKNTPVAPDAPVNAAAPSAKPPAPRATGSALPSTAQVTAAAQAHRFVTGLEQLPKSLQGTSVDGEILIDEQKNLHVTRGLRQLFDYFLSTLGEEDLPTVIARVEAYLRQRTPEPAQSQVIDLFHRYLRVQDDLRHVKQAGGGTQLDLDAIARQKAAVNQIRHRHLSNQEIAAFFGPDDALDDYTLKSLRIQQDSSLSASEKARQLADLSRVQPPGMAESQKAMQQYQQLETLTAELKARKASPAELHDMRVQLVGPEATARLEALDQQTSTWNQQVSAYLAARQKILQQTPSNPATQQQQIAALRQQMGFDEADQLRLPTYEQHPELLKP